MELVSQNSDAEVARGRALERLNWPLKELAANMVRIIRGAGRPAELPEQMAKVLERLRDYHDAAGYLPSAHELTEILSIRYARQHRDGWTDGVDEIVQGALQIAASQLIGQSTQESAGESELMKGWDAINRWREKNRRGRLEEVAKGKPGREKRV